VSGVINPLGSPSPKLLQSVLRFKRSSPSPCTRLRQELQALRDLPALVAKACPRREHRRGSVCCARENSVAIKSTGLKPLKLSCSFAEVCAWVWQKCLLHISFYSFLLSFLFSMLRVGLMLLCLGHCSSPRRAYVDRNPKKSEVRFSSEVHGTCFAPGILISAAGLDCATKAACVALAAASGTVGSFVPWKSRYGT
jgi:hypothetical protein